MRRTKELTIPISLKSGNYLLKRRWYYYHNYKKKLFKILALFLPSNKGTARYNFVRITVYKVRKLDYDNMVTGCKPILDYLTKNYYITDDNPNKITVEYIQKQSKTEYIVITLIDRKKIDEKVN